jgi:hypothetical protein
VSYLTFPATPLPLRGEFFIVGQWVDITGRIRLSDEINITGRGRNTDQGRPVPLTCTFTLNNRDGLFSNRNPLSPYYGVLPRNTPVRFSVTEDRSSVIIDPASTSQVRTVDKASLTLTDIDVRAEVEPEKWSGGSAGRIIASKWLSLVGNNREWALTYDINGYLQLWWSPDGTAVNVQASSVQLPRVGPIAVRATMDVDNGAGSKVITFYTSDTIAGTWTQLGAAFTLAGTTSIFNGVADLSLGRIDNTLSSSLPGISGMVGRVYGFELRSTIGGTVLANASIYNQPRGTTTWSDGLASPNTWLVEGNAELTPDVRRFTGEISSLPVGWDTSGKDVYVQVQAADVTRRLSVGASPIQSAMRRYFTGYITQGLAVTGYFPCEDSSGATALTNVAPAGKLATITSDVTFSDPTDFPATAGAITLANGSLVTMLANFTTNTGSACLNFAFKLASLPAAQTALCDIYSSASATWARINVQVTPTGYIVTVFDYFGSVTTSGSVTFGGTDPTKWTVARLQTSPNGSNVQVDFGWYPVSSGVLFGITPLTFAGGTGRIGKAVLTGTSNNAGIQYCHLLIGHFFLNNADSKYVQVANAFAGESTVTRFSRLCLENNILGRIVGASTSSEIMGPQPQSTALEALYECSDIENGPPVYPDRNSPYLILRTRRSVYAQVPPVIDYSLAEIGPDIPSPIDDDQNLRNVVTAARADGTAATFSQTVGPNSINAPTATPSGVGIVSTQVSRNAYDPNRLTALAAWEVELGTWDEPRWPTIVVQLERQNYVGTAASNLKAHNLARIDVGDFFRIIGLPNYAGVSTNVDLITQGISETLGNRKWRFSWNTSPYGPYAANNMIHTADLRDRAAASNTLLGASFNATALSFIATTATGALWGTTALKPQNFPQNVVVAGEVMTISGITGTGITQTFTVSARGVNTGGVGKAHNGGEFVQVQYPFSAAL